MATAKQTKETQAQEPQGIKARIKKNPIISAVVGLIVLVAIIFIGVYLYKNHKEKQNQKAATELALGQDYFARGQFDQALNGDNAGYAGFSKIAAQYSGTSTANLANLYAGLCYYYKADYDNAIKYLEEFDAQDDAVISNNGIAALANCYAKKGNIDKAVDLLEKAAKRADNPIISPACYIQAGVLLESQNKADEALKLYQEVKNKYPESTEAQSIDKYILKVSK